MDLNGEIQTASFRNINVRPGAYRDSIVLMQLQVALAELPGVEDAGAVMATPENLGLLEASGLLPDLAPAAKGSWPGQPKKNHHEAFHSTGSCHCVPRGAPRPRSTPSLWRAGSHRCRA